VRRVTTVLSLAAAALLALGATPMTATAAVSPAAGLNAFTLNGNAGSYLLGAGHVSLRGTQVSASPYGTNGLHFSGSSDQHNWTALIAAPTDTALSVGTFETRRGSDATTFGLDLAGDGRSCNEDTGSITIHEVARNDAGDITSFAASFTQRCENTMPPVTGELRFNSSVDYMAFADTGLGKVSAAQTLTVKAAEATTMAPATVTGETPEFRLTTDSCKSATLPAGGTCTITVVGTPTTQGPHQATITVPDAVNGDHVLALDVTGVEQAGGGYTKVKPARLLDTRSGLGVPGGSTSKLGAGKTVTLQVTGRGGVAASAVSAAVLNLTVTGPTSDGYLTAYPTGQARPGTSSINFPRNWTGANLVTVPVGTNGQVSIYNFKGATHVVADVMGYYRTDAAANTPGSYGGYFPVTPERWLDTRDGSQGGPLPGGYYVTVPIGFGEEDNPHITAFAVNVTMTKATRAGYLTAFDGDENHIPNTSTLNFLPGQTVTNMAIVPTSPCYSCTSPTTPMIGILNGSPGTVEVIVDIVGVYDDGSYDDGLRFKPLKPTRIVDTRKALGTTKLGYKETRTVTTPASIAGVDTFALVTNTTGILPTAGTFLTLWAHDGSALPGVSNLNPGKGQVVSNMTMTELGAGNDFNVYNRNGSIDVAVDVTGTMESYPASPLRAAVSGTRTDGLRSLTAPRTTFSPEGLASSLHRAW
jgi:hypothetical protein